MSRLKPVQSCQADQVGPPRLRWLKGETTDAVPKRKCAAASYLYICLRATVLQVQDVQKPSVGSGEVLVRMKLRPVNPADISLIQGRMGRPPLPLIPGTEGAHCPAGSLMASEQPATAPSRMCCSKHHIGNLLPRMHARLAHQSCLIACTSCLHLFF